MMNRRTFVCGLTGTLSLPFAARAQVLRKVPLIGALDVADSRSWAELRQGLNDLGWAGESRLTIEPRWHGAQGDRYRELAVELVRMNVDVLVTGNWQSARAAKQATKTIPIVLLAVPDPPAAGLVGDQPDRNVTGVSYRPAELVAQSIEIIQHIRPGLSRIAHLYDPRVWDSSVRQQRLHTAAIRAGLSLLPLAVSERDDLETALGALTLERPGFLIVDAVGYLAEDPNTVPQFAIKHRFPAISGSRALADAGLLISHGPALHRMGRRAADYVHRILKGAQPADLALEVDTTFELAVNSKTAKALGLTIPQSVLGRADQVIE
jgi:putative ABC transport system substrate-binding protein